MLSTESRRGRRILARIDRGTDLFDGLRALCQRHHIRCGEVRGSGILELAELTGFDQDARRWKASRLESGGSLELLQLQGTITEESGAVSIQVNATLMRDGDGGMEVVGGQLRGAVAYSVELVVETFDDVLLRRQLEPSVGLSLWSEALSDDAPSAPAAAAGLPAPATARAPTAPRPAPAVRPAPPLASPTAAPPIQPTSSTARSASPTLPPPHPNPIQTTTARPVVPSSAPERPRTAPPERPVASATPTPSWAEVAAASETPARAGAEASEEEVQINAGDVILHPRFQRCVVHRVEHSGDYVQVMLRNGRVVRLSLEVLRLTPQGIENGQRIFTATVL